MIVAMCQQHPRQIQRQRQKQKKDKDRRKLPRRKSSCIGLLALGSITSVKTIRTKNWLMVAFDSNKGPNLKVVKWS